MKNLYLVFVSLLGAAGLSSFASEGLPQHKPAVLTLQDQPQAAPEDTTRIAAKQPKKKNKKDKRPSAASVTMKRDVNRATISQRSTDGSQVEILIMNSGAPVRNIEDLQMVGSSGSPVSSSSYNGFDNVTFPFEGNIRFKASNKMGTAVYDREVRFKVNEPGHWTLRVDL